MTELPTRRIGSAEVVAIGLGHLAENVGALSVRLDSQTMQRVGAMINDGSVSGPRYAAATQAEIDTEELAAT